MNTERKLCAEDVVRIRELHADRTPTKIICDQFGISRSLVALIVTGSAWRSAGGPIRELPLARRRPPALVPSSTVDGAVEVPLTRGLVALIDESDAELVGRFVWCVQGGRNGRIAYAVSHVGEQDVQTTLHRFLWKARGESDAQQIDHVNRNGLDCRRQNLRAATCSQNTCNTRLPSTNTTGYRGVIRGQKPGTWASKLTLNGRSRWLGTFDSPEAAARVFDAWVIEAHGEFAAPNFPDVARRWP